jgi:putative heme-binding domain-containing protein
LFFGKATCSTCHAVRQEGGTIGPDLTTIGAIRSGRDLIESLVLPSATIAQKYETYNIITAEGRVIQGILARQSKETLVVYDAAGAELRLRADQIDELHVSRRSLMPDGLLHVLSRDEIRDLLAYLSSLK